MKTFLAPSRRTFGKMLGAAAVATPGLAVAMPPAPRDETILSLVSVPLAWPQYHRIASFERMPRAGDDVVLERQDTAPFDGEAIRVRTLGGEDLGYIPRRHAPALSWALERGEPGIARLSHVAEPMVRGQRIAGWASFHVDIHVSAAAAA